VNSAALPFGAVLLGADVRGRAPQCVAPYLKIASQ
jgi:hypothetical protein